jgi:hypothetical protein
MPDRSSPFRQAASAASPGGTRARDVKEWMREATGAGEDATLMVSELACSEPGCPPYEVVMAVLRPGAGPLHKKLHMRLAELTRDTVRQLWLTGDGDHHHPSNACASEKE